MSLDKESILSQHDLPLEEVPVPEWGGSVWVRTLTAGERDAFEASVLKVGKDGNAKADLANVRARLAALTICDDKGARLFSDVDANHLGRKSAKVLDRICDAAKRLNGMTAEDVDDAVGN